MAALEKGFAYRILIADDDPGVRETSARILSTAGYEVRTAVDGFDALAELRRSLPDLIISDLRMPNMSGFELLSIVRRRFPHIPVIAMSAEFQGTMPVGLIADSFLSKGEYGPQELFGKIRELIESCPLRPHISKPDKAPVWIPKTNPDISSSLAPNVCGRFPFPKSTPAARSTRPPASSATPKSATWQTYGLERSIPESWLDHPPNVGDLAVSP